MSQNGNVFVLNMRGEPIMPCSCAKARHLLKADKAFVRWTSPFTIQLRIAGGESRQPVTLVIDQKGTTIRLSASTKGKELYAAEIATDRDNQGRPFSDRDRGRRYRRRKQRSSTTNARTACLNKCIKRLRQILPVTSIVVRGEGMDVQSIQSLSIGQGASEQATEQPSEQPSEQASEQTSEQTSEQSSGGR